MENTDFGNSALPNFFMLLSMSRYLNYFVKRNPFHHLSTNTKHKFGGLNDNRNDEMKEHAVLYSLLISLDGDLISLFP